MKVLSLSDYMASTLFLEEAPAAAVGYNTSEIFEGVDTITYESFIAIGCNAYSKNKNTYIHLHHV